MLKKKIIVLHSIFLILFVESCFIIPIIGSFTQKTSFGTEIYMTLDIIFIGIDSSYVDTSSLEEYLQSYVVGIPITTEDIVLDLAGIGSLSLITWDFKFNFATDSYYSQLKDKIIENGVFETINNQSGYFIDAPTVERWMFDPSNYPTGFSEPTNGYSLFLGNFSELGNHWFRTNYSELDTGSNISRSFQNSFGGTSDNRIFYIDLSVIGSYLHDFGSDGPIQNLTALYDPETAIGRLQINGYFRDWIYEIISDLFLSNIVYATPNFRQAFSIEKYSDFNEVTPGSQQNLDIYLINNITGKDASDLAPFINTTKIQESFTDVLPWYNWNINLIPVEAQEYSELAQVIANSTDLTQNEELDGRKQGGVDLFNLYDWFFNEILYDEYKISLPFLKTDSNSYITLAFAFDVGILGTTYKGQFSPGILGISLYGLIPEVNFLSVSGRVIPLTIAAQSYENLFVGDDLGRTYGFTQLIIHENGHSIGASHPHGTSWAASMVNDPMSYIAYSYEFSRFKKDQVWRGEINQAFKYSNVLLEKIFDNNYQEFVQNEFDGLKQAILSNYVKMDYEIAYEDAWTAFEFARDSYLNQNSTRNSNFNSESEGPPAPGFTFIFTLTLAFISSLVISVTNLRRKRN